MSCNYTSDMSILEDSPRICTLDNVCQGSLMKIYCACGRIVDLDRNEMNLKISLKKGLECTTCRNARISEDIDLLNDHFNGNIMLEEDQLL